MSAATPTSTAVTTSAAMPPARLRGYHTEAHSQGDEQNEKVPFHKLLELKPFCFALQSKI
jgi:hypothetical protein